MNICVIPARGGSKRIPLKNIRPFCNKPIIIYSIENAIKSSFNGRGKLNYGEYFIYLVYGLTLKKIIIEEVGYISKTRKYGESKTASSIFQLLSRGLPYLKAAYECRKLKNANF